jgi:hypothetical protein
VVHQKEPSGWHPIPEIRRHITYIGPPNGPIQRPKPVRYVQYECYEATARSETVLVDLKSFSILKLSSQVGGVVETEVWTADKQPVAFLAKT